MSEPVLAPEEIEALMAEVGPAEHSEALFATLPPVAQPEQVEDFKFGDNEDDGPDKYPMFVNLHERLIEILDEQWDELFKRDTTLEVQGMEAQTYKNIIANEDPLAYFVFKSDTDQRMMLTFDIRLIVAFVDAMLGGDGEAAGDIVALSAVEMKLSQRIAAKLGATLCELWQPVHPMAFDVFKIDTDPQFLAVTSAKETCFTVNISVMLSEDLQGSVSLHYPMPFLDPVLEKLRVTVSDEPRDVDAEWSEALWQRITETPTPLRFELDQCSIDIGTFLSLKPGDFLPITKRKNDPCTLWVSDIPMFQARPGEQDGMLAAELL
ncbi:MAG: FliM/FliN family flagellar motor switch protein [Mariprofundaceae bacterium]